MNERKLLLRFPEGTPSWARWGRRIKFGDTYYRVGRASRREALLYSELPLPHSADPACELPSLPSARR